MIDEDTQIIGKLADLERKLHAPLLEQWKKRARVRFGVASALLLIGLGAPALLGPTKITSGVSRWFFLMALMSFPKGESRKLQKTSTRLELLEPFAWLFVLVSILVAAGPDACQSVLENRLVWIALLVKAIIQLPRYSREFEEALLMVKRVP